MLIEMSTIIIIRQIKLCIWRHNKVNQSRESTENVIGSGTGLAIVTIRVNFSNIAYGG